jgi:hypothetical protein
MQFHNYIYQLSAVAFDLVLLLLVVIAANSFMKVALKSHYQPTDLYLNNLK